jgi:hypothetical protein
MTRAARARRRFQDAATLALSDCAGVPAGVVNVDRIEDRVEYSEVLAR